MGGEFLNHYSFPVSQVSYKIQHCQKEEVAILERVVGAGHTKEMTFEQRPKPEDLKDTRKRTPGK